MQELKEPLTVTVGLDMAAPEAAPAQHEVVVKRQTALEAAAARGERYIDGKLIVSCRPHPGKNATSFDGHKIDTTTLLTSNCDQCIAYWFFSNAQFLQQIAPLMEHQDGVSALIQRYGKKFTNKALRFIATVKVARAQAVEVQAEMDARALSSGVDVTIDGDGLKADKPEVDPDQEYEIVDSEGNLVTA